MNTDTFDIQQLVNASGVSRRTIYFYVQQGLLPPPQGAGLAAYYTRDHLLRLQVIPILRRKGFRLDQIREQFTSMKLVDLQKLVENAAYQTIKIQPPSAVGAERVSENLAIHPSLGPLSVGWDTELTVQYTLPAGIRLIAPEKMSPEDRRRLEQLLFAARQIFNQFGPQYVYHASGTDDSK